MDVVQHALPLW